MALGVELPDEELVSAALVEIDRGATWVKVIADFPDLETGTPPERNDPIELVARLCEAVHGAGGRVAVRATLDELGDLVRSGGDIVTSPTTRARTSSSSPVPSLLSSAVFARVDPRAADSR
jgi:hypothetical protein